jgi:hypothetical protein
VDAEESHVSSPEKSLASRESEFSQILPMNLHAIGHLENTLLRLAAEISFPNGKADISRCDRSLKSKASKKHSKEYNKARARYPSPEY